MQQIIKNFTVPRLQCLLFLFALCVYAFKGSPTPDHPGYTEAIIAALLVVSVGFRGVLAAFTIDPTAPLWRSAGQVLLLYGLSAGVISGLAQGQTLHLILRDLAPFLFMMMPVLYFSLVNHYSNFFRYLLAGIGVIGVLFALRGTGEVGVVIAKVFFLLQSSDELLYLANMPTLLFTGLIAFGYGAQNFVEKFSLRSFILFIFLCGAFILTLLPISLTTQRASIGLAAFYVVYAIGFLFYKSPRRTLVLMVALIISCLPFFNIAQEIFSALAQKNEIVGGNMRFQEATAVWAEVSRSIFSMFFGMGWGGTFHSPAVGELRVNFSHSLLTSIVLKLGLLGLLFLSIYLIGLARAGVEIFKSNPILAMAIAIPAAIDVFLYASFKSLDFGLMLMLIPASLAYQNAKTLPNQGPYSNQGYQSNLKNI